MKEFGVGLVVLCSLLITWLLIPVFTFLITLMFHGIIVIGTIRLVGWLSCSLWNKLFK